MPESIRLVATLVLLLAAPFNLVAEEKFKPEQLEFFESKIRPVLAERCYKCHSAESEELKGSLRLDSRQGMLDGTSLGRFASIWDIANAILFLSSAESDFITGQQIVVDGGFSLKAG